MRLFETNRAYCIVKSSLYAQVMQRLALRMISVCIAVADARWAVMLTTPLVLCRLMVIQRGSVSCMREPWPCSLSLFTSGCNMVGTWRRM